jgi:hypothetical protein
MEVEKILNIRHLEVNIELKMVLRVLFHDIAPLLLSYFNLIKTVGQWTSFRNNKNMNME